MKILARLVLPLVLLALASAARADSFVSLPELDYASDAKAAQGTPFTSKHIRHVIYPVLGFPSLVEPAGTIAVKVALADGGGTKDFTVSIVTAASSAPVRYALPVSARSYANGVYTLTVRVPAAAAAVYDLEVKSAVFGVDRQPNAVRILRPGRKDPSFAVLADSQLQDVRVTESPARLRQMLAEVRLRDPDFCLFLGDMGFGSDYASEYDENWRIFSESGLAIFMVPGNHDGYATVVPGADGQPRLERDGLSYWRRTIGPTDRRLSIVTTCVCGEIAPMTVSAIASTTDD